MQYYKQDNQPFKGDHFFCLPPHSSLNMCLLEKENLWNLERRTAGQTGLKVAWRPDGRPGGWMFALKVKFVILPHPLLL